ncbi:hypothetical protein SKAU_G00161780 [Synaphobranchus kaupii]|uniref:Uncharacterized protein n=1 Tax=Synaphobranchus kaupii TaxID=118154 RepID=A0A9Q1FIU6_SYNKA|nr:hypothetical protein SKAU_G00161780 [Synaphobranchus kaupii]
MVKTSCLSEISCCSAKVKSPRPATQKIMGTRAAPLWSTARSQAGRAAKRTNAMPNPGARGRQSAKPHQAQLTGDWTAAWIRSLVPFTSFSPPPL